jgi:hypothetical protein
VRAQAGLLACRVLPVRDMANVHDESWTIPLHVIMWTVISVGFIMMLAIFLMH